MTDLGDATDAERTDEIGDETEIATAPRFKLSIFIFFDIFPLFSIDLIISICFLLKQ